MIIPAIIGIVAVGSTYAAVKSLSDKKGVFTPERETIFNNAMNSVSDPEKLKELADVYEKEGLPKQAEMLRKRAALRAMSPELKKQRQEAIQKALSSTNKEGITAFITILEEQGMTGSAQKVREYLSGLAESDS